jgi:hypothetical protein
LLRRDFQLLHYAHRTPKKSAVLLSAPLLVRYTGIMITFFDIKKRTALLGVFGGCVVVGILFFVRTFIMTPSYDDTRADDIRTITAALELYAAAGNGIYPVSLDVLVQNDFLSHVYLDPATGRPYQYLLRDRADYSVCTTWDDGGYRCVSSHPR